MFQVNEKELKELKLRGIHYNLEETWAYDFFTDKKLCKCFVVIDYFFDLDKQCKKPNKKYFKLCREAAYHISREFGKYWDNTTFASDGKKISRWIKENPEYDTIKD